MGKTCGLIVSALIGLYGFCFGQEFQLEDEVPRTKSVQEQPLSAKPTQQAAVDVKPEKKPAPVKKNIKKLKKRRNKPALAAPSVSQTEISTVAYSASSVGISSQPVPSNIAVSSPGVSGK